MSKLEFLNPNTINMGTGKLLWELSYALNGI